MWVTYRKGEQNHILGSPGNKEFHFGVFCIPTETFGVELSTLLSVVEMALPIGASFGSKII